MTDGAPFAEYASSPTPPPRTPFCSEGEAARITLHGCEIVVGSGILSAAATDLLENVKASNYVLITDERVAQAVLPRVRTAFTAAGLELPLVYTVREGEGSKSRRTKQEIEDWMMSHNCDRKTVVIALGGGVVGDLSGFVASTYMRGVRFVQMPTSLLAMVDASVGGKTGIDVPAGKNLVGAFHTPERVFIDISLLDTLPVRHFRNGLAEVIKMGAILDKDLFELCEKGVNPDDVATVGTLVLRSVELKAFVVEQDEREAGLRGILNFGHTVGHAIEALMDWSLLHGECVSIGMVVETAVARGLGATSSPIASRVLRCCRAAGLPVAVPPGLVLDELMRKMSVDKKSEKGAKRIVILRSIGESICTPVTVPDEPLAVALCGSVTVQPHEGGVSGVVKVPGSKSISNRVLLMAVLGTGDVSITGLLHSDDTQVMLDALQALGAEFEWDADGGTLHIKGTGGKLTATDKQLHLGNAGTASRLLTTAATLVEGGQTRLTGVKRMKERPIGDLVNALRSVGCEIAYEESEGALPLTIQGGGLVGGSITLEATVSSQFVTSILISGVYAANPVVLSLTGDPVSQPYIDMTTQLMDRFGQPVTRGDNNTYSLPVGAYTNPPTFAVESDASSATYPLCFAAVLGGTVTVDGVGSESVQGDAGFCNVLRAMGCEVVQTENTTTVTGPARGELKAVDVDMYTMTDAFMGAAAVAALATGTSRFSGIANQRVKECNRLEAMVTELGKLGVVAREIEDGIELDGVGGDVSSLHGGVIDPRHDHRLAMSFAILASVLPGVIITQKDCVGKTYAEFWDDMSRTLGISVRAVPDSSLSSSSDAPLASESTPIVIVGMRGAGKSSLGAAAAEALGRPFIDLDDYIGAHCGVGSATAVIETQGWEAFRKHECECLREVVEGCADSDGPAPVVACGGGIVESPACVAILKTLDVVINIARPLADIESLLNADTTRPAYPNATVREVYERRAPTFHAVSTHEFPVLVGDTNSDAAACDFIAYLHTLSGHSPALGENTFFLSLTFPDLHVVDSELLAQLGRECDALELRVDLLEETSVEAVREQLAVLRRASHRPVIFTVRSVEQGGAFAGTEEEMFTLLRAGVRWGCEYVDVEACFSRTVRTQFAAAKGATRVISSFHLIDFDVPTTWDDLTALANECYNGGAVDIVKVVFPATSAVDCTNAHRLTTCGVVDVPVISVCLGPVGALSRVLNPGLTPVTHAALPAKAAPGQLTQDEIVTMRQQLNLPTRTVRKYYLFGSPISASLSPAMHNAAFASAGLPHVYGLCEATEGEGVKERYETDGPAFGGGSVTIPLKEKVSLLVSEVSESAQAIGAINTLVACDDGSLRGDNTDWIGIHANVEARMSGDVPANPVALVVGAGGTARAAVYALKQLACKPTVYIHNRTTEKATQLASEFGVEVCDDVAALASRDVNVVAIVSTLPPTAPSDVVVDELLSGAPVVLDAVYRPRVTPLLERAAAAGCPTVQGVEMLVTQGEKQFELWTGVPAPKGVMGAAARAGYVD